MTNRHGKKRSAKRRMSHKRAAPSDRRPEDVYGPVTIGEGDGEPVVLPPVTESLADFKPVLWYGGPDNEIHYFKGAPSITCPVCMMTSYNPTDIDEGYCGNCHDWTRR